MKATVTRAYQERARGRREHWWFAGRRRLFRRLLDAWVDLPAGARIVDLGPGYGVHSDWLASHGRVLAVDLDPASLGACATRGATDLLRADAGDPPIADASCDLLAAFDILEHLDDDGAALRAWHRMLRPGGWLLLSVPALPVLWGRQDVQSEHRRRYRRRDLRARIEAAGLRIERLTYCNCLMFLPTLLVRLAMRPLLRFGGRRSDLDLPAPFGLDRLLAAVFASEGRYLVDHDLPIGVSLLCLARRPAAPGS